MLYDLDNIFCFSILTVYALGAYFALWAYHYEVCHIVTPLK